MHVTSPSLTAAGRTRHGEAGELLEADEYLAVARGPYAAGAERCQESLGVLAALRRHGAVVGP